MRRRTVLASLGSALGVASTAGCLGSAAPGDSRGSDPSTTDRSVAFAGIGCPSFGDADRTVCSTTASSDALVVLTVERPVFEPTTGDESVETLSVVLENRGSAGFGFNPYGWTLYRQEDDDWSRVAPDAYPEPWTRLAPGETYTYELSVETHPSPQGERRMDIQQDLDDGVYALVVDGFLDEDEDRTQVECVAVFAVEREG